MLIFTGGAPTQPMPGGRPSMGPPAAMAMTPMGPRGPHMMGPPMMPPQGPGMPPAMMPGKYKLEFFLISELSKVQCYASWRY